MNTLLSLARTALCAGLAALALAQPAAATPLARTKSFEGPINFVGTQASLQGKAGGNGVCGLASSTTADITLPSGAAVASATLYWTGTGPANKDMEVLLNDAKVSAPADRRYSSSIDGYHYFSGAEEVTTLVQAALGQGNKASFTFGGLEVDVSAPYCANQQKENTMVAGFALVVVYAHKDERYRTVNVYEGLQAIKNSSVTVSMPEYTPAAGNSGSGKFGYIVWEGDKTGNQKDDYVSFAGEVLRAEPYIQKKNAFNSKSGANRDENSMGIDFDIVELPGPPAKPADAKAVFTTTSDRVLLGTAIVALPSANTADLAITKSQAGDFKQGSEITYTLEVANKGARGDSAVEVKDTLPDALTYVSASGLDWSCAVAGQAVTCKYGKQLAPGSKASVQIQARITGEGKIKNTATVKGTADGVPGNDSSSVEGNVSTPPTGKHGWMFTTGSCTPGETIRAAGEPGEPGCARFQGPVTAGSKTAIYLTQAVDGLAKAVDAAAAKEVSFGLGLVCNNPAASAGTDASYAGATLDACLANGMAADARTEAQAKLTFEKGAASARATFHYPDVGLVTLRMRDTAAGSIASTSFASVPAQLRVVYMRGDGVPNPGKPGLAEAAFAEAGEPFVAVVSALGEGETGPLPNFGRESGEHAVAGRLLVVTEQEREQKLLVVQNKWALDDETPGVLKQAYVWDEAGMASLAAKLESYLGAKSLATPHEPVGRFYPAYLKTETEGAFGCLKRMSCPQGESNGITQAVFSGQPFGVTIRAYGRTGHLLERFVYAPDSATDPAPAFMPEISVSAVNAPGPDGKELDKLDNAPPSRLTVREPGYRLANGYDAKAGTRDWTPPVAVYVRAAAQELRKTAGGSEVVKLTSGAVAGREAGVMVVNGRLMVANVIGSPLARTAVPLRAQYWSGSAWEQNSGVTQEAAAQGKVEFFACRRSLRMGVAGDTCDPAIVKVFGAANAAADVMLPKLEDGKANLILAPVGSDKSGTVDLFIHAEKALPYLPSTFGRVSFGQFKSPVIYVREMY